MAFQSNVDLSHSSFTSLLRCLSSEPYEICSEYVIESGIGTSTDLENSYSICSIIPAKNAWSTSWYLKCDGTEIESLIIINKEIYILYIHI